jgi:tRNA wybutosine-synthesizing protein 3
MKQERIIPNPEKLKEKFSKQGINNFQQRKNSVLNKKDKSSIGNWDKRIVSLCDKINEKENLYTTSSCSGRLVLMKDNKEKGPGLFIEVFHDNLTFMNLKKIIEKNKDKNLKIKVDPCILHIVCISLEDANELLNKARESGWKKSGILSFQERIVLELNGTERLEFPVISDKNLLIGDEFLKKIVFDANKKLEKSWRLINQLKERV